MRVLRPGLLTTVQDCGRRGFQKHGVVAGGALDDVALRIANLLVGNDDCAAGLECTLTGPDLEITSDTVLALGGADLSAVIDGLPVPVWRPFLARAGSRVHFGAARSGARCYLAISGGIDVPVVLGGRGTDLRACMGGVDGRALLANDNISSGAASPLAEAIAALLQSQAAHWSAGRSVRPGYSAEPVVRVLPGAEQGLFQSKSVHALMNEPFEVTAQSNRMGYRMAGPSLELRGWQSEMISSPVTAGTIQVPSGGAPILLMADRQTTGGYPRIAHVITVDLPLLAQAPPGTMIRFASTTLEEAHAALRARERNIRQMREAIRLAVRMQ